MKEVLDPPPDPRTLQQVINETRELQERFDAEDRAQSPGVDELLDSPRKGLLRQEHLRQMHPRMAPTTNPMLEGRSPSHQMTTMEIEAGLVPLSHHKYHSQQGVIPLVTVHLEALIDPDVESSVDG